MGDDLSSVGPGSRADVPTQRRGLLSHGARFCPAGCESRVRVTFPRWNIGGEWRPQFQLPAGGAGWGPPPSLVLPMASGRAFVRWPRGKAVLCSLFPRRSRKWRRRHDTVATSAPHWSLGIFPGFLRPGWLLQGQCRSFGLCLECREKHGICFKSTHGPRCPLGRERVPVSAGFILW